MQLPAPLRRGATRARVVIAVVVVVPLLVYWYGALTGSDLLAQLYYTSAASATFARRRANDPHFHITWKDYTSTSGQLRVMSAAQDHRRFPSSLAAEHRFAFPALRQMAALVKGSSPLGGQVVVGGGGGNDGTGEFVIAKLDIECINHRPANWAHRIALGTRYSDLILRCIAFLPPEAVDQSLCINAFDGAECRIGHVVMHDTAGGTLLFPMDKIMHFPNPVSLFSETGFPPPPMANSFPTAPWRARGQAALPPPPVKRVAGAQAEAAKDVRTCAWVAKKYSWDAGDELWLLWMLDVVGLDFVSIYLVPSQHTGFDNNTALFNTTTTLDAVRKRIDAHPGLRERVLLVQLDIPGSPITLDHMIAIMHWDGFVRLQADCDYGFSIDTDEYVDLYDVEPPHERVDIKTFIGQRNAMLDVHQVVCMHRLLTRIAHALAHDGLGKCLWKLRGNLKPYLHYPDETYMGDAILDNVDLSHMLHVRMPAGYVAFSAKYGHSGARPQDLK